MSNIFKKGDKLDLENLSNCTIERLLGSGGQGEVYEVHINGKPYALKWYFDDQVKSTHGEISNQETIIRDLIKKGSPNKDFLWPIDIARSNKKTSSFGYIMDIRTSEYKSLFDLMKRRAKPSFYTLVTAAYNLVNAFHALHAKGLSYCDISHGNVFFNDKNGDILICDNDNVTVSGSASHGVLGTQRFMAPEIVRKEGSPNTYTDLYSLAVLLFYMLHIHHPLEGALEANIKVLDNPAMELIYGNKPVFIFDPNDISNRPVPGYQDNAVIFWNIYPKFLQDLFVKSFTVGLKEPQQRISTTEWKQRLLQLRDSIILSSNGIQNFFDITIPLQKQHCWKNKDTIPPFFRLQIGSNAERMVVLDKGNKLYSYHLNPTMGNDISTPLAEVVVHPQNPNIMGLKNLSGVPWQISHNGNDKIVNPNLSLPLASETLIKFGSVEGKIIYTT